MICKTHKIASAILISLMVLVILLSPNTAKADNDDLAFDFVSAESSVLISVDECFERGVYTFEQAESVKGNESIYLYDASEFVDIGDFCQQVYEEL